MLAGGIGDISIYGQELNYATWRLSKMNLAIRGIDGQIAQGNTFHNDRFSDLKGRHHPRQPSVQRERLAGGSRRNTRDLEWSLSRSRQHEGRNKMKGLGVIHEDYP